MKITRMNMRSLNIAIINSGLVLLILITGAKTALAKDFGIRGHSNKILEQPFLEMIKTRLLKVDMEKERKKMEEIAKERIANPHPVENMVPATKQRVFYFDPTYTLKEDIILPCGKILHKAGTKVNPLDHMDLNRRLFFIDSNNKAQVKWLKKQMKLQADPIENAATKDEKILKAIEEAKVTETIEDKIILVSGSPIKFEESIGREVYFDQSGELTTRFGIKASPAIVEQEGKMLKIVEVYLGDEGKMLKIEEVAVEDEGRIEVLNKVNIEK